MKRLIALLLSLLLLAGCTTNSPVETTVPTQDTVPTETTQPEETTITFRPSVKTLSVHFIDVGQADCALIECNNAFMLIDGGNEADSDMVVEYLEAQGVQRLNLVVGTHPHEDHIGGLPAVLKNYPADNIWSGPIPYTNSIVNAFLRGADKQGKEVQYPEPGQQFHLDEALITVLGPVKSSYEDVNDLSLVLMIEFGDVKFLFTGDMEQLAEGDMLDYWGEDMDFSADVLKVGHHGSYSSTGYRFLREVLPTYGVISVGGNNDYGHPHNEPISRLQDAEVQIYRTDKMYDIVCVTDGEDIVFTWENTYAKPWIPDAA